MDKKMSCFRSENHPLKPSIIYNILILAISIIESHSHNSKNIIQL